MKRTFFFIVLSAFCILAFFSAYPQAFQNNPRKSKQINKTLGSYFGNLPYPIKPGNMWYYTDYHGYNELLQIFSDTAIINGISVFVLKTTYIINNQRDSSYCYIAIDDSNYSLKYYLQNTIYNRYRYYKNGITVGEYWIDKHPWASQWFGDILHTAVDTIRTSFYNVNTKVNVIFLEGEQGLLLDMEWWSETYGLVYANRPDNGMFWLVACKINDTIYGYHQVFDGIKNENTSLKYNLWQNYPNPFNLNTTIKYFLNERSHVSIVVFDLLGNKIVDLIKEEKPSGEYTINFKADGLPSGIYIYELRTNSFAERKKMILLK